MLVMPDKNYKTNFSIHKKISLFPSGFHQINNSQIKDMGVGVFLQTFNLLVRV